MGAKVILYITSLWRGGGAILKTWVCVQLYITSLWRGRGNFLKLGFVYNYGCLFTLKIQSWGHVFYSPPTESNHHFLCFAGSETIQAFYLTQVNFYSHICNKTCMSVYEVNK